MKIKEQTTETNRDSGILSNPLSFVRNGDYIWYNATHYYRSNRGYFWSLRSADTTFVSYLAYNNAGLNPQNEGGRGNGFAVRCVSILFSKSFTTLINTSYSMKNNAQTSEDNRDSGVLSNPLSFIRSGDFDWNSASLGGRNVFGSYWSLRSANTTTSSGLDVGNTQMSPQYVNNRGYGFAVRCFSFYAF